MSLNRWVVAPGPDGGWVLTDKEAHVDETCFGSAREAMATAPGLLTGLARQVAVALAEEHF